MTSLDTFVLWLRTFVARLAEMRRQLTRAERILCAITALGAVQGVVLGVLNGGRHWTQVANLIVVAVCLAPVLADAIIQRDNLKRAGAAMVRINSSKPTGAPRIAEVACRHGDPHRFVYGPSGWEAAGPAVEHRPTSEEARSL